MRKIIFLAFVLCILGSCKKEKLPAVTPDPAIAVSQFSSGGGHTMLLKSNGDLWAVGWNDFGFLGYGNTINQTTWVKVATDVKAVEAGYQETFIIKRDNSLWGTGRNIAGNLALGDGTEGEMRVSFTKITDEAKQVFAGAQSTFVIKSDKTLWSAGFGYLGMLGNLSGQSSSKLIKTANKMDMMAGGSNHTLYLVDGSLGVSGANNSGQLGVGLSTPYIITPNEVVLSNSKIKQIAAGRVHSLVLLQDGTVWGCGYNAYGQLGDGTDLTVRPDFIKLMDNAASIAVSKDGHCSFIVKADGTLWVTGFNNYGQLGLGNTTKQTAWIKAADGVKAVSAGTSHTTIQKADGSLWAAGANDAGQLGTGIANATAKTTFTKLVVPH